MKLNLGFESFPYPERYGAASPLSPSVKGKAAKNLSRAQRSYGQGKTTRDVAGDLEAKYKIVEAFYEMEEDFITELIEEKAAMDLDDILTMGTPSMEGMSFKETDKIEERFRRNLSYRRYDGIISGVPTLASLKGVSHLRQRPYAKGSGTRPSFVDTGLYSKSFRVWMEE
jgi:hypothetical protein